MFDIGWMELLLIGIVALIVVGPKDLPKMFRTVGQVVGKARGMAREFQRSMEQAAEESGLREAARDLNSVNKLNLNSASASRKRAEGLMTGPTPGAAKQKTGDGSADAAPRSGAEGSGEPASGAAAGGSAAPRVKAKAAAEPAGSPSPGTEGEEGPARP